MDMLIQQLLLDYEQGRDIDRAVPICYPKQQAVQALVEDLQILLFPGYCRRDSGCAALPGYIALVVNRVYVRLESLLLPLLGDQEETQGLCRQYLRQIPDLRQLMQQDLEFFQEADPAADGPEEIIMSYPGFYAIFVYRLAHGLWRLQVPVVPRMMTELAHSRTGIDIHPGARIAGSFFIDHGTGVVIGETTEISHHVKLYQGVTLGALSTRDGRRLKNKKRHPTLHSHVTVYAGASILGGDTVIGEGAVIGANAFVTASVKGK